MIWQKVHFELLALYHHAIVGNLERLSWASAQHVFVNFFVESFRAAPYTLGHVAAIGLAAWIIRRGYAAGRHGAGIRTTVERRTRALGTALRGWGRWRSSWRRFTGRKLRR